MSQDQYSVVQKTLDGKTVGVISGMGQNAGTWDATHSLAAARRFAADLKAQDPAHLYVVEDLGGPVDDDTPNG